MDMTTGPSLDDMGRMRLTRLAMTTNAVVSGFACAALRIDAGEFAQAQTLLLGTLNTLAQTGVDVFDEASDAVQATLGSIHGHRHQTCAVRSCLDAVQALHVNPRSTSMGERIGRIMHALAVQMAARSALPKAA